MNLINDLRGIVTVLNTPFTPDDKIDESGLRKHVDYAIGAGVAGFLAPAMAGEVAKLTAAERDQVIATILDQAAGRVPLVGGASAPTESEILENARRLIEAGCQGVLAQIPFTTARDYETTVERLANLDPGFLILQDWDVAGTGLPVDFIARLAKAHPKFQGIKIEVMPAGPKYTQVLEATQGKLHISGGWGALQLIEGLDRGLHAFMPTALHHTYTSIYRDYHNGNEQRATDTFHALLPILAFTNQQLDISIHFFKRLLHTQGIYETPNVRQPIHPFDQTHERYAKTLIEAAIKLESSQTP